MTHTPLTKAEREELQSRIDATIKDVRNGRIAFHIPPRPSDTDIVLDDCRRVLADLDAANGQCAAEIIRKEIAISRADAAEAERDEIKTALGVMGATRERALEVAGSQDALEERIDSMSRERDVALKGWSAAEAARDAAAAQRDRAESELDAERKMRVEAEAASDRMVAERDTLKAHLDDANENLAKSVVVLAKSNKTRDDARKSLESLRNAINSFDGADSAREVKAPVGRAIGIIADQRAEIVALKAKLERCETNLRAANSDCAEADTRMAALKAKLAALANAAEVVAEEYEDLAGFGELDCLAPLYAAIAAARGGAQ